jgi:fumarate reductase subunit C
MWLTHRLTAAVLAPLVVLHLGVILYAVGDGLSAAEILARTRGSAALATVYVVFVIAAALHGAAGLRSVVMEATTWRGASLDIAAFAVATGLLILGLRAVSGLVL